MNYIIVLASGSGKRMGTSTPKQFIDVLGKPLICYSLQTFNTNENIDEIIIVTKKKYFAKIYDLIDKYNLLSDNGLIICEYETEEFDIKSFKLLKEKKYGLKKIKIITR